MEYLFSIISGGASGAILVFLLKGWISERLKQSIQYEYSEKLANHKIYLNSKIDEIRHEYQIAQLRTSLFFDHQRRAYACIISKTSETMQQWSNLYDPDDRCLLKPVPHRRHSELEKLIDEHQLFLDEECLMSLQLVMDIFRSSLPYDDRSGAEPHQSDSLPKISTIEYIQPRLASVFKSKIGTESNKIHSRELATLCGMMLINGFHFPEICIPATGNLSTIKLIDAVDIVTAGLTNNIELIENLRKLDSYLNSDGGWIPESQIKVSRCLSILETSA